MAGNTLLQTWRRFPFFEQKIAKETDSDEPFLGLQELDLICSASGNGQVFLAESGGCIFRIAKRWEVSCFRAYKVKLYTICYVRQHNILFTVGEDETGVNPYVKAWLLDKTDKQGNPFCSRCTKASPNNRPVKVTALAVHSSCEYLAVGFEDSSLILYKGDAAKERQGKPQVIQDGLTSAADGSIVGLAFQQSSDNSTVLYMAATHKIVAYFMGPKEKNFRKVVHGQQGCMAKCWALADKELHHQFVVARRDFVHFYLPEDSGGYQPFEGDKVCIKSSGNYLVIVVRDGNVSDLNKDVKMHMVTVYDIPNTYIAYSAPIPEVSDVFFEWGSFFVLTKSGKIYQLIEKDTQTKIDILFRKNLYELAVKLAENQHFDRDSFASVCKQYGDYLYQKGEYTDAVRQYIRTIGTIEPSYVIRKLLDSQRIEQLTMYLESLHKGNVATSDHTTILLNCYTKLNSSEKIEQFVKSIDSETFFDVDTAVRVLRGAGYVDVALWLSKEQNRHDLYLHTLLEDKKDYSSAIAYISQMELKSAEIYLKKYGKILMSEMPDKTTDLLKQICLQSRSKANAQAHAEEFIHIFVNNPHSLCQFLEHLLNEKFTLQPVVYNTLLELYLRECNNDADAEGKIQARTKFMSLLKSAFTKYDFYHVLLLCQMYAFDEGALFLYERGNLTQEVLRHFIQRRDFDGVLETCKKYASGEAGKEMWIEALWFVAQNDFESGKISKLLQTVQELEALPPLMVLEILSHSRSVTLGVVKSYLLNWLNEGNREIEKCETQINHYREEIQKTEEKIVSLKIKPQEFQMSRCSGCGLPLELPTVHCLCKHSYHQHCFESYAYADAECPHCAPNNRKLREAMAMQDGSKESFQQLQSDLKKTGADPLKTVSEYFGKGVFQSKQEKSVEHSVTASKRTLNPFEE